ncbi:MAG: acyl-[acyl-carrier-protein] thioesterase, partial [Blautia wexlerae]
VQKHHLDTNHHVNNCQYIRMAADHLPEDFKVGQLRAEYKRQAVLDNVIIPEVYMTENKEAVVLNAEDKEPYAVVEFTK